MNIDSTKISINPMLLVGTTLLTTLSTPLYPNTIPIPEENYYLMNYTDDIIYPKLENHFEFETNSVNESISEPIIKASLVHKIKVKINSPKPLTFQPIEDKEGFI